MVMMNGDRIPVSDHVTIVKAGDELPGELTPAQKALIELSRKEMIKKQLESCNAALKIVKEKVYHYTANGNSRKLSIYQAKETELVSKISELEQMLIPKVSEGKGGVS